MIGPVSSCAIAMPGKTGPGKSGPGQSDEPALVWLSLGLGAADVHVKMVLADARALHLQLGAAIETFAHGAALSAAISAEAAA